MIRLWTNLPSTVDALQLYRKRWRIEGMFQRLESVLHSEIKTLGRPRAALLGFATAVLAYNVLSLLKRSIEQAHRQSVPELDVSTYYLAIAIRSDYHGLLIALPASTWTDWTDAEPVAIAQYLLELARYVPPRQVRTRKRKPKTRKPKRYVDSASASAHASTARELKKARTGRP